MSEFRFEVADVAGIRFAISPLWETVASLGALADPGRHSVHLPWLRQARKLASDPELARRTAPLRSLIHPSGCLPDFLTPPPAGVLGELEDELAVVSSTAAERVRAELAPRLPSSLSLSSPPPPPPPPPPSPSPSSSPSSSFSPPLTPPPRPAGPATIGPLLAADPDQALRLLTDGVRAWWEAAIQPHWARVRAVLEADIAHRTRELSAGGVQALLDRLHPTAHWRGDRLVADDGLDTSISLAGRGLPLMPTVFSHRCVLLTAHQEAVPVAIYPARAVGTLWERRQESCGELERLLGRSRARILALTAAPSTTTQLAARTGLSAGAVSQHLGVLKDAGLVTGHRYRHEVHYSASELGLALLGGS